MQISYFRGFKATRHHLEPFERMFCLQMLFIHCDSAIFKRPNFFFSDIGHIEVRERAHSVTINKERNWFILISQRRHKNENKSNVNVKMLIC